MLWWHLMMTSSNGNILRVTGHLCGEFTGPRWIPRTEASDAELWWFFFNLCLNKRLCKQSWGWWFETLPRPLWRQSNVMMTPDCKFKVSDFVDVTRTTDTTPHFCVFFTLQVRSWEFLTWWVSMCYVILSLPSGFRQDGVGEFHHTNNSRCHFNIKIVHYQYRTSSCVDKTNKTILFPRWDFMYW